MYFPRFIFMTFVAFVFSACVPIGQEQNNVPLVYAGADQTVAQNTYVFLRGTASDSDGSIVSYQWSEGSKILSSSAILQYNTAIVGTHVLTLIAQDNKGARASDTIIIKVQGLGDTSVLTTAYEVQNLGSSNRISHSFSLGTNPKSVYLVMSNTDTRSSDMRIRQNIPLAKESQKKAKETTVTLPRLIHRPEYVKDFQKELPALLSALKEENLKHEKVIENKQPRAKDTVGTSSTMYLNQYFQKTTATARKVVSNISTNMGTKTLNVWVSNDSFDSGSGCAKVRCVTQNMVDALANSFLKDGLDNDIYDWVSNIFGEEWGTNSGFIGVNNEITILLTDIDQDNSADGGVIGFYWSKDNLTKTFYRSSNERIMFYIDAVMFANGTGVWDIDDQWPKEVISTLAHEFQHMISFYQKEVLLDTTSDIWLDEMLAETTEDMVATKFKHKGPRGVNYWDGSAGDRGNTLGRYPLFNSAINQLSLTAWTHPARYSKVNAFGTYLTRNYGGAKLLHDMMYNRFSDEQAVVSGVNKSPKGANKTFKDLLHEWAIAVMLSNNTKLENYAIYNTANFMTSTYNSSSYEMGSINFFNYSPQPAISTLMGTIQANGNYYYKLGDNLTGNIDFSLELNGQTEVSLIIR